MLQEVGSTYIDIWNDTTSQRLRAWSWRKGSFFLSTDTDKLCTSHHSVIYLIPTHTFIKRTVEVGSGCYPLGGCRDILVGRGRRMRVVAGTAQPHRTRNANRRKLWLHTHRTPDANDGWRWGPAQHTRIECEAQMTGGSGGC